MDFFHTFWGMLLLGSAPYLALGGGGVYLGVRYLRVLERRNASRSEIATLQERVLQLEEGLSRVAGEVEAVSEGQHFTAHLLGDRAAVAAARAPRPGA